MRRYTWVFIYNSPHNPTGHVHTREEMEGIAVSKRRCSRLTVFVYSVPRCVMVC